MDNRIRVLIVEDSVADMEIDVLALESSGFEVSAIRVETEAAFRDALESHRPHVVLSDHSMPRFDASRALSILHETGKDIPFIIVSGKIGELAAVDMMKSGASDYVIKNELARLGPAVRREIRDVEERCRARETRRRLAERERTLENLMHNLPGMVYRLRKKRGAWYFEFASDGCHNLTGYTPEELLGQKLSFDELVYADGEEPDGREILDRLCSDGEYAGEHRIRCYDGEVKWTWHRATLVHEIDGELDTIEGFVSDITAQKIDQARLNYLAHHDVLTGLANRTLFEDMLSTSVARAERHRTRFSLLFVDLDDFKDINDAAGHAMGDSLLCAVAERLIDVARGSDVVARLGGDEFAVVIEVGNAAPEAAVAAQRILDELSRPLQLDDQQLRISASIGIATFPEDGHTVATLLSNADAAMYSAKQAGRNTYRFFASEMNTRARDLVEMRSAIPQAIQENQFELHFQPQLRLSNGELTGVETLLRWNHPERGQLTAGHFIPVAEEGGLVAQVDQWVARAVCEQARRWADARLPFHRIALNLSARSFHDPSLVESLRQLFAEHRVDPSWLEVELTETAMMQDVEAASRTIKELQTMGLLITVDDFGTGFSSLSYLKRFSVDRLKIDRAFVSDLPDDTDDLQICRSIMALANSMSIEVVAEGIETPDQAAALQEIGCRLGQGYHFARPTDAARFTCYLRERVR